MSLINRIEVSNFLNSNRQKQWDPDIVWEIIDLAAKSAMVLAPNGTCKTSLTLAIFAILTRKMEFIRQAKKKMSPKGVRSNMSHIRIEFLRPHDETQDQHRLGSTKIPVKGDTWVFGICGHNDKSDDLTFYHFRGTLETVPLGEIKKGVISLFSDPDIRDAVNAAPGGVFDVGSRIWKSLVADHIPMRQLRLLEQFHNKGGGDHNAPLFPVDQKGGERYDEAFFYQHVVPHLVSGIHQPGQDEQDNGAEGGEESLEETLINGSLKLLKSKEDLEKTKTGLEAVKATFEDLQELGDGVNNIQAAEGQYQRALSRVAEVGAALRAISDVGVPGLPRMVRHSDPKVNALLSHMAIRPGEGVYLRALDMDELLGLSRNTRKVLAEQGYKSTSMGQVIEVITGESLAKKDFGPGTGRYLSEEDAVGFIQKVPESYLRVDEGDVPRFRERAIEVVEKAFEHFRKRMDTSPHRKSLTHLNQDITRVKSSKDEIVKLKIEATKEIEKYTNEREKREDIRAAWVQMRNSELFTAVQLEAPIPTEKHLSLEKKKIEDEIESLGTIINKIGSTQESLRTFSKQYPGKRPLEVEADLERQLSECKGRLARVKHSLDSLRHDRCECEKQQEELGIRKDKLQRQITKLDLQQESLDRLHRIFPEKSVEDISAWVKSQAQELRRKHEDLKSMLQSMESRHSAVVEQGARVIRQVVGSAAEGQGKFKAAADKLNLLLPDIASLEAFREELGSADPFALKDKRAKRLVKIQSRLGRLDAMIAAQKRHLAALEQKSVAPGRTAEVALAAIPEDLDFGLLHEAIEAAGLPPDRKDQALRLFSPLIFSPVVKSAEDASAISEVFDAKKFPVPVFLEDGLNALLASGDFSDIQAAIHPHMGEMVDLILHPEKVEAAIHSSKKRLGHLESRKMILRTGEGAFSPESRISWIVKAACDAVTRDSESRTKALARDMVESADAVGVHVARLQAEHHAWPRPVEGEIIAPASLIPGMETVCFQGCVVAWKDWLAEATGGLGEHNAILREVRSSFEDKIHQAEEAFAGQKKTKAKETEHALNALEDFERKHLGQSDIARDLAQATGYSPEAHALAKADREALRLELKAQKDIWSELVSLWSGSLKREGLEDGNEIRLRNSLDAFDFKLLADFIESDEGKNAAHLEAKRARCKKSLAILDKKLRFQFEAAERYVPVRKDDEEAAKEIEVLQGKIRKYEDQAGEKKRELQQLDSLTETIKRYSRDYDSSLIEIQREMKRFAQLLADVEELVEPGESPLVEQVKSHVHDISSGSLSPNSPELVEAIAEVSRIITGFKAEHKARRAQERRKDRDRALEEFRRECSRFISKKRKGLSESILMDVEASKKNPGLILKLRENLTNLVAEKEHAYGWQSELHQKAWDDQVTRLVDMSAKAILNYRLLNRVCKRHETGATFYFEANIPSREDISKLIEAVRDRVEVQFDKQRIELERGNITKEEFEKSIRRSSFKQDIRKRFYSVFFAKPTIKFRHPLIAGGQTLVYTDDDLSGGQRVALQLLMVVRLAEFSKDRDYQAPSRGKANRQAQSFVFLDGMLSSLSDDELIDESLRALEACQGVFQLIGLIHNKGYVNNYDIFPTFIVARRFVDQQSPYLKGRWVRFATVEEETGNLGFWNSKITGKTLSPPNPPSLQEHSVEAR